MNKETLERYKRAYEGNLTSYMGLFGDSFKDKIDLLGQLVHKNHYPSLGEYKEKLLRKAIKDFLPDRYKVGTGFVIFIDNSLDVSIDNYSSHLPIKNHTISRQLDIIVYDSYNYAPIFRDDDFVILKPECVRTIIEVKSTLDKRQLLSTLDLFKDYSDKWNCTRQFYDSYPKLKAPLMILMAWSIALDKKDRSKISGKGIRETIVNFYKEKVNLAEYKFFPHIDSVLVYDECIVEALYWLENWSSDEDNYGYYTSHGRYKKYNKQGKLEIIGDKTIGTILAKIHYSLDTEFNPRFAYLDQNNDPSISPYKYQGFESWIKDEENIKKIRE